MLILLKGRASGTSQLSMGNTMSDGTEWSTSQHVRNVPFFIQLDLYAHTLIGFAHDPHQGHYRTGRTCTDVPGGRYQSKARGPQIGDPRMAHRPRHREAVRTCGEGRVAVLREDEASRDSLADIARAAAREGLSYGTTLRSISMPLGPSTK